MQCKAIELLVLILISATVILTALGCMTLLVKELICESRKAKEVGVKILLYPILPILLWSLLFRYIYYHLISWVNVIENFY